MVGVLVYEHICASAPPDAWPDCLRREGRAMLEAVLDDFSLVDGCECLACLHPAHPKLSGDVTVISSEDPDRDLAAAAREADAAVAIAPEFDGILASIARTVLEQECRLLGPGLNAIGLFADKLETARRLGAVAVNTRPWPELPQTDQIIIKPRDGAGSLFTVKTDVAHAAAAAEWIRDRGYSGGLITQPFIEGSPASVAVVADGARSKILPYAYQTIVAETRSTVDGIRFDELAYRGGVVSSDDRYSTRIDRMVDRILRTVPDLSGYLGVDLIFGADDAGTGDLIVEVNPRFTTSFVAYHALYPGMIAQLLLGRPAPQTSAPKRDVPFDPAGNASR